MMNRPETRRRKQKKNSQYSGLLRHKTYTSCYCEASITEKNLVKINGEIFVRCPKCGYEVPIECIVSWKKN